VCEGYYCAGLHPRRELFNSDQPFQQCTNLHGGAPLTRLENKSTWIGIIEGKSILEFKQVNWPHRESEPTQKPCNINEICGTDRLQEASVDSEQVTWETRKYCIQVWIYFVAAG
jgi:hypothetical protein